MYQVLDTSLIKGYQCTVHSISPMQSYDTIASTHYKLEKKVATVTTGDTEAGSTHPIAKVWREHYPYSMPMIKLESLEHSTVLCVTSRSDKKLLATISLWVIFQYKYTRNQVFFPASWRRSTQHTVPVITYFRRPTTRRGPGDLFTCHLSYWSCNRTTLSNAPKRCVHSKYYNQFIR